jgi:hypothetical protein
MNFKNEFERVCFEATASALGRPALDLRHNHILTADFTPGTGIISFTGPPKKEIDVLIAELTDSLSILISLKDYEGPAPPAVIQEWATVLRTMNTHATRRQYLGLVVSARGFTSGCVPWAMGENIGLIPPYKGKPIGYPTLLIPKMLERAIAVIQRLSAFPPHHLSDNSNLYWSLYKCLSDYPEGEMN